MIVAPAPAPQEGVVLAYFDGLCEPTNPRGHGCGGWWVPPQSAWPEGLRGARYYGHGEGMTNNVAEYNAALDALRAIYATGWRGAVELRGDSRLVTEQYSGRWACRAPLLGPLLARLRQAAAFFTAVSLVWVPREANAQADALSRQAYRAAVGRAAPSRTGRSGTPGTPGRAAR